MTVLRLEHIGIVVDDVAAATAFFVALGLELEGEASVEGRLVDRINGLEGVRADVVILRAPDGGSALELAKYRSPSYEGDDGPAPANAPGIRHILFVVDDVEASLAGLRAHGGELVGELVNYEDSYWLCYVRGPAGIIVELTEKIGRWAPFCSVRSTSTDTAKPTARKATTGRAPQCCCSPPPGATRVPSGPRR
jgi:catechol 2,3-dioxygenase-like lactoylglutathione lyase family enzyme